LGVSIHAPARSATKNEMMTLSVTMFQSTRPHGARPSKQPVNQLKISFNPRARTERDEKSS